MDSASSIQYKTPEYVRRAITAYKLRQKTADIDAYTERSREYNRRTREKKKRQRLEEIEWHSQRLYV